MTRRVNECVSKEWAAEAKKILTSNSPDCSTLYHSLFTALTHHQSALTTQRARDRLAATTRLLQDGVKYGWAFGLQDGEPSCTRPPCKRGERRIYALLTFAIRAGAAIGRAQRKKIESAHGIPRPGTFRAPEHASESTPRAINPETTHPPSV